MSEETASMAVITPEEDDDSVEVPVVPRATMPSGVVAQAQSSIWLETHDGAVHEVEREITMLCPLLHREVLQNSQGGASKRCAIALPNQVGPNILKLILEYCRFHQVPGRSDKERKMFDEKFIRLDTRRLCELASAAKSLDMNPLVDLACRALARMIEGMTPEEMRETFHLPDDLTEEEKLEPVKITTDDPRIRLLNQLYARKRRALQEKKRRKDEGASAGQSSSADDGHRDDRSVDDLLSFIDGSGRDGKGSRRSSKSKKRRNRKKKEQAKDSSLTGSPENRTQSTHSTNDTRQSTDDFGESRGAKVLGETELATDGGVGYDSADFDDEDDDGLDPEVKEKLDREVEDFARRLNSGWPDRIQEILALASSSQERSRNSMPTASIRGPGSHHAESSDTKVAADCAREEVVVSNGSAERSKGRNSPRDDGSHCTFRVAEALTQK